jgi:hypothetical protein
MMQIFNTVIEMMQKSCSGRRQYDRNIPSASGAVKKLRCRHDHA